MKRRKRRKKRKPNAAERSLIELAAEPVPLGSGLQIYGEGPYAYGKTNIRDGSMRYFCFRTEEAMREAMAAGMAADVPLETPGRDLVDDEVSLGVEPPSRPRSLRQARRALRRLYEDPSPLSVPLPEPGPAWHRLYTRRICRYLMRSLTDDEMRAWEIAFTALHELVGHAWGQRPADPVELCETEAWANADAATHFSRGPALTLLPADVDLTLLVPHMRGFLATLRDDGAMTEDTFLRLDLEYARLDPTAGPMAAA